ncbi:MAG: DMT family transporter [Rhizobiaceae bacterium]
MISVEGKTISDTHLTFLRNPFLLLTITTLVWGGNAVAGKFAVGHISPMILTASRWTVALSVILLIAHKNIKKDWPIIRKNWLYLLLMGGFGFTAFNFCLYSAVHYISAINVALEQSAMPLVIFVLNFTFYKTGIKWVQIIGFSITLIGVLVTISMGDPLGFIQAKGEGINRGDLFMLIGALFYGGYTVALRSKPEMHWQSFLASLAFAALLFSIVGAAFETAQGNAIYPTSIQGFMVVIYTGVFPSLVSQAFYIKGNEALGANVAGLFINLVPVFAALLAVLLLGEQLHWYHVISFGLVMGGILLAQRKPA